MPSPVLRFLLVILPIALFNIGSSAQKSQPMETKTAMFRIVSLKKLNNDSVAAALEGGAKLGVKKGMTGPVKGSYKKGDDRSSLEVGFASVIETNDVNSWVIIRPMEDTSSKYESRVGDYVRLSISVPKVPYHSIFFELALQDIKLNNMDGKPLYSFESLIYNDGKKLEDSILSVCINDVVSLYNAYKDDTTYKTLHAPMKEGRFNGKSVFEVMKSSNAKEVMSFLNYVNYYSKYYTGTAWSIGNKFGGWVMSSPGYTKQEIRDSILAYKNNVAMQKRFIQQNLALIKSESFVLDWIGDAVEALKLDKETEANNIFYVAYTVLPYEKNDCYIAYYHFQYAEVHEKKKEYSKQLICYDTSYAYFDKCGNTLYKIESLMNKAATYTSMDKDDDALNTYDKAFAQASNTSNNLTEVKRNDFYARYYYSTGMLLQYRDSLKQAANRYEQAIKYYKLVATFNGFKIAIKVQDRLATLYKKQGESIKALAIYNEQLGIYTKLNDRENIAQVLDNIAFLEFNLANYRKAMDNYSTAKKIHLEFNKYSSAGYSQSNIGQAYWNLGKYDSAIAAHQIAIGYRRMANSFDGLAYSWKKVGDLYKKTGEKDKAFFAYDSSSHYYTLAKDSVSLKDLLSDVGDIYYNDKQHQKAFDLYLKRHKLNLAGHDKIATASSAYQVGEAATYFDMKLAKTYALSSLELAQQSGDKNNEYNAYTLLGFIGFRDYDYDDGEKYFSNALNIAIAQKNKNSEAVCYQYMSRAYSSKLDFDKAILYVQKAIHIADSLGDKSKLPDLYRILGSTIQSKGDFYEARKQYQKSIDIAYSINSRAEVGYGYSIITFLYVIQGELAKADQAADSTFNIFSQLNNSWQMAEAYSNKGLVYEAKADGINAVKYYLLADSIYKKEKEIYSQSICQTQLGCVYYYQADYDNALKYFYEADRMLSTIKTITEAHILSPINIGEALYFKKEYAKAEPYLLKGYQMANEKKAGRMQTIGASFLGTLYYDLKKYELSEKYLLEGFAYAQKSNETDLYINSGMYLGKLYAALNQPAKAEEYYKKTVDFLKTIDHSKYTWMALYEYGLHLYNNKNYDSAIVYFKKAVEIVENSSQNLFGGAEAKKIYNADERKVDLYNKLVASLAKTSKKEDALYYADRGNNQAIKEQSEKAGLVTNDKEKNDAIKKGGELLQKQNAVEQAITKERSKPEKEQNKELIASLESIQKITQKDYINYINALVKKYPDMSSYFSKTNPADFKNNMKYIPDSTLAVLYIINDKQLFIFTATKQEIGIKTIDLKNDINKQAEKFWAVLKNPANVTGTGAIRLQRSTIKSQDGVKGDFKTEASVLYDLLITPIQDQLKDKKNICIIPNSKLSNIPFQAIGNIGSDGQFHFLVEDYAIFYTNKMDIFSKPFEQTDISSSFIALGNPDKSLPNATTEVKNFSKVVKNATILTENAATETKATDGLSNYRYVHFATHGVLDYAEFEKSYLVFAPETGSNSDGKLTIEKINGLSISNCSLVTLSACETAVSNEAVKGWYISPANSFLQNNVSSVVASLWKVDDEATSVLMQEFYKNLLSTDKKVSKIEALRKAQETLSKDSRYAHPYFWAAFVLYGEWR